MEMLFGAVVGAILTYFGARASNKHNAELSARVAQTIRRFGLRAL